MTCPRLSPRASAPDRWHGLWCAACRRARRADREIDRLVARLRTTRVPDGGLEQTLTAVGLSTQHGSSATTRSRWLRLDRRSWGWAALATGACAVVALSLRLTTQEPRPEVPDPLPRAMAGAPSPGDQNSSPRLPVSPSRIAPSPRLVHQPPLLRTPGPGTAILPRDPGSSGTVASSPVDDLQLWNDDPMQSARLWVSAPNEEWAAFEARVRGGIRARDDFVEIPLPRLADANGAQMAAAVESYRREAAIVDARLARQVTVQQKTIALSDLCDRLRAETGISLSAGQSVADDKVTLLCKQMPLRDVMRQLSRPFGYAWTRAGKDGAYRYELLQDLKSQLVEEELRNRDRNAALLAVDQEMQRYRPYLGISPMEARARLASASPAEKPLLEHLARAGWGPAQMYFRLSPRDLDALRAGRRITFSAVPGPGEQLLPSDLERGVLQTMDTHRILVQEGRYQSGRAENLPQGLPPATVPEARAHVVMELISTELGQFMVGGGSGFTLPNREGPTRFDWVATGLSPSVTQPRNEATNARWSRDSAQRTVVTIEPTHACSSTPPHAKAAAADVLEALHRATGMPIVADAFTRLYPLEQVTLRNQRLFGALNQLSDRMRLRWNRDGEWLQFRSTSYFHDRVKEVPNYSLARLAASRRERKVLSLDDLLEIAQLPDAQLDAGSVREAVRECYGLAEWDLAGNPMVRPHLRLIAELSPPLRQQAQSPQGLPFTRLSLSQQQRVLSLALAPLAEQVRSLEELTGTAIRVDYTTPGGFRWNAADNLDTPPWGVLPRLSARAPTREGALQAARRIDPMADATQIVPMETELAVIYLPDPRTRFSPTVIRAWSRGVRFTIARPLPSETTGPPAAAP